MCPGNDDVKAHTRVMAMDYFSRQQKEQINLNANKDFRDSDSEAKLPTINKLVQQDVLKFRRTK